MFGSIVTRLAPLGPIVLIALSAPACSGPTNDAFSAFEDPTAAPEPIRAAAQAVVRINTASGSATGVFLSKDGVLLTNNHVLGAEICPKEGCYARFSFAHERESPFKPPVNVFVQPLHVDIGLDMAVVQAYSVDNAGNRQGKLAAPHSVELASRDAESLLGTQVHVIGHPEGRLKKWTTGDVADTDGSWFQATSASLPGNSGSPILNDSGQLVGLLHRGPTGEDLITENGANLYSIGTASAAIDAALKEPLPATVPSLSADRAASEVAAQNALYLHAHAATATVGGAPQDVLTILGQACDQGLARDDYTSPEDFYGSVSPCLDSMQWISCTSAPTVSSWGVCPDAAEKDAWRGRYQKLFEQQRALNGELWLDMVSFALQSLESSDAKGIAVGRASLTKVLDQARPPLDPSLAVYLAAFGIDEYDGDKTVDFLRAYESVPHYELAVPQIVYTALWLSNWKAIDEEETKAILARLAEDDNLSLGDKLLIEEVQYNWGFIK